MPLGIGMIKSWKLGFNCITITITESEQVVRCVPEGNQYAMKKILVNSCFVTGCYDLLQLKPPAIFNPFVPYT